MELPGGAQLFLLSPFVRPEVSIPHLVMASKRLDSSTTTRDPSTSRSTPSTNSRLYCPPRVRTAIADGWPAHSGAAPTTVTRWSDWLKDNADCVGRRHVSALRRHCRRLGGTRSFAHEGRSRFACSGRGAASIMMVRTEDRNIQCGWGGAVEDVGPGSSLKHN